MRSTAFEKERLLNDLLCRLDSTWLSERALAKPASVSFSIGTACDLKCIFCSRQHFFPADSGFMDFERFQLVVPELAGTRKASLFGLGDPLLNRRFIDYVRVCHAWGIEASATTHAMHLTEPVARAMIEEGMEEIAISIDATDAPLLEYLRPNSDFDLIKQNVRRLAELKREAGAEWPVIIITCTMSLKNLHEMPGLVRLAADLGAQVVCFSDMVAIKPEFIRYTIQDRTEFNKVLGKAKAEADQLGIKVGSFAQKSHPWEYAVLNSEGQRHGCSMLWDTLIVEREGDTRLCCYLGMDQGHAFQQTMDEVMQSPGKLALRKDLMNARMEAQCRGCASLVPNSRDRVLGILNALESDVHSASLLSTDARDDLHRLIRNYRTLCDQLFPAMPASERNGSLLRSVARKAIPPPVRRAVRNVVGRFY